MSVSRFTVGVHLATMAWLLLNGLLHTAQVLWKAHAGTLSHPEDLGGLLGVGGGLLLSGAAYAYGLGGLRREPLSLDAALGALGVLALVILWIVRRYGFGFLLGTLVLAALHGVALILFAIKHRVS